MSPIDVPLFPQFVFDQFFWVTKAMLPAWAGYSNGGVPGEGNSDGMVQILFAPEGRDDSPLQEAEVALVSWVIEHQEEVHGAMLHALHEAYPQIRQEFLPYVEEEGDVHTLLPEVSSPGQLKKLLRVSSINVHQIQKSGLPFIGVELECTWDEEHGAGVLLHGARALEVGDVHTAITLWIAEKHAETL